jgi:hypothetical protein
VRTLFAKILAWFVVSAFLVFAGIVLTSALNVNNPSARQAPVSLLLNFLLKEARYAHETGGQEALRGVIQRTESVIQSRAPSVRCHGWIRRRSLEPPQTASTGCS